MIPIFSSKLLILSLSSDAKTLMSLISAVITSSVFLKRFWAYSLKARWSSPQDCICVFNAVTSVSACASVWAWLLETRSSVSILLVTFSSA